MPASSRNRMCEPYASTWMFSTRDVDALPVRTVANSLWTNSSVFIIFSSMIEDFLQGHTTEIRKPARDFQSRILWIALDAGP